MEEGRDGGRKRAREEARKGMKERSKGGTESREGKKREMEGRKEEEGRKGRTEKSRQGDKKGEGKVHARTKQGAVGNAKGFEGFADGPPSVGQRLAQSSAQGLLRVCEGPANGAKDLLTGS